MSKQVKTIISFVGTNDAGTLLNKTDGAIITALKNESFDEAKLIWNDSRVNDKISYADIMIHLKREIKKQKLCTKVEDEEFELADVTDHNEIYGKLKSYSDSLPKNKNIKYSAAISSGTPAMQVSWILLAESGDFSEEFPLRLIKVIDPKFGKSKNIDVKLDTGLPRIVGLKKEVEKLRNDLIPNAVLNLEKATFKVGETLINLAPIEFCYYRYFGERKLNGEADERFAGITVSLDFMRKIYAFHEESFEYLDLNRLQLGKMIQKKEELAIQTFRGNISKLNKKIRAALTNESLYEQFSITTNGNRGAKFYGIKVEPGKMVIEK